MKGLEDQDGLSEKNELPPVPEGVGLDSRVLVLPVNGESRKLTQILSNGTSVKILELLGEKSMSATDIAEQLDLPLTTVKYNLDSLIESDLIKVKQIKWSQKGRQVKIYEPVDKVIVLVPSKGPIDRLSIINLLQKYLGVIVAAFFAAAGIEYFAAYMQAKRVFDATAPARMAKTESTGASPAAAVLETNASSNLSAGNLSTGMESSPAPGAAAVHSPAPFEASVPVSAPAPNATDSVQNLSSIPSSNPPSNPPSIPPESLAHAGGAHGLYDALSLHPGVWFLFGCVFIVFLLIVREIYYKKRAK